MWCQCRKVFLILHIIHFLEGHVESQEPKLILIDTDAGVDDGVALSYVLGQEAIQNIVKVVAITTVHGNTDVINVGRNVLKVLKTAGRLDIPVYRGANQSLLITPPGDDFFGEDGFGDIEYPDPPSEDLIKEQHAVNFLTTVARENPGKLHLLALGPLTNIALAIRLDPDFFYNLASVVILGGSVQGVGNVKPGIEFNVYIDPEATFVVFTEAERTRMPIQLVSWEAALSLKIEVDWRTNVLGEIDSPVIDLLNKAEALPISKNKGFWISSDTLAAVVATDPYFPLQKASYFGEVETCGRFTRGAIVIDYDLSETRSFPMIDLILPGSINVTYYKQILFETFTKFVPGGNTTGI